jgi:hypothetical protein
MSARDPVEVVKLSLFHFLKMNENRWADDLFQKSLAQGLFPSTRGLYICATSKDIEEIAVLTFRFRHFVPKALGTLCIVMIKGWREGATEAIISTTIICVTHLC